VIWATYRGGAVRRGFLVGTRTRDTLDIRYVLLNNSGETSSGSCQSTIDTLQDGRLRLDENWQWESRAGGGTNVVEELAPAGGPSVPPR